MSILSLLGKKGTVDILKLLDSGIDSFSKLKENLDNNGLTMSTRTLSQRLSELEEEYLIEKVNGKYYLTPKGKEALKIINDIIKWEKEWEEIILNKILINILRDKDN
ncbi:winged helix-turn-helix transcriptional regulator [Methanocaldococcus sp.]